MKTWPIKLIIQSMFARSKFLLALFLAFIAGCVTTPISHRSALILVPFGQEVALGAQAFGEILKDEKESENKKLTEIVQRVGKRIAAVSDMPNLKWEFKLIESDQQNAFALPGGKTAVYTGILAVCKNEAGLAAVMGHEIAHVIARHGAQRMTQQLIVTAGLTAASISLADSRQSKMILGALGVGVTLGIVLPFSRSHEAEADQIGLIYMARAGYDPREAVRFWTRFSQDKKGKGKKVPEFLSTHPTDATRINILQRYIGRAISEYERGRVKYGLGETLVMGETAEGKDQKPRPRGGVPGVSVETLSDPKKR